MTQRKKLVIVKIISVTRLYLSITRVNGHIKEKDSKKYLVFDSTDEKKELLKNIMMFLMTLKIKSKK